MTQRSKTHTQTLVRIWGARLLHETGTGVAGLNDRLVPAPGSAGLRPSRRPSRRNVMEPVRVRRQVFERVIGGGHWPVSNQYVDPATGEKYNLFHRVEEHLPGSADWLMHELRPLLQGWPTQAPEVAFGLQTLLARFGCARVDPFVSLAICLRREFEGQDLNALFIPPLVALARQGEPVHVRLLYLLWLESTLYPSLKGVIEANRAHFIQGWNALLSRPEFQGDQVKRDIREAALALGRDLEFLMHGHQWADIGQALQCCLPLCPIWVPTEERTAAQARLRPIFQIAMQQGEAAAPGPLLEPIGARPVTFPKLTRAQRADVQCVVDGILAARTVWGQWSPWGGLEVAAGVSTFAAHPDQV